ncbi:FtsX-like permease family protein [Phenylobacterium sp.]|uniref:ABC transporter permease n=1 Tax=Phenylobacterium sp. TaxID=1871053 RepID=UPI0028111F65|nr:FtsX-like permease family protein [Phenylobacterium sp.]
MTPLALRFALRELRSGVAGFRIFLACLALGVAALAAAGSTAEAFRRGLAAESRAILGGDAVFSVSQRRFTGAERASIERLGPISTAVRGAVMAEAPSGARRLADLRGVGPGYPLVGTVELRGAASLETALRREDGAWGAAVEQPLLDRLGLRIGDRFEAGGARFVVRAVLVAEPDRMGRGFALAPRVLARIEAVEAAGVLTPGGLFGESIRVLLPTHADPVAAINLIRKAHPDPGFDARDRSRAAAGAERLIDQLEYYLGFIGLAALVAGGLGVAGAVSAYLEGRKPSIATLKALGATGALIRNVYLIQVGVLAALGLVLGLAVGASAPLIMGALVADRLPLPALFAVYPAPLLRAALFGGLAALAFALAPLARARRTPPVALFRQAASAPPGLGPETLGAAAAGIGLVLLAIATAPSRPAAVGLILGTATAFALLWALGNGGAHLASRLRRGARGALRLGLANLAGPRSAARTATPSIGLGVALLTAVMLVQSSLLAQIREVAPRTAPSTVFTEIPADRTAAFEQVMAETLGRPGPDRLLVAPVTSGRIVRLNGQPVDPSRIAPGERWAYDEDLIVSAVDGPRDEGVVAGRWWRRDYRGPPVAAMEVEAARGAGLRVGDTITVQVLGREIDARLAVLRRVDWSGFGLNFALVLNTGAIEGAQPRRVAIARASAEQEAAAIRRLGDDLESVNVISVREQLEQAASVFEQLTLAVRGAAAVAGLAGVLVLAGAVAADARGRAREGAVLKVLGATRGQVLLAYVVEFGLVGLAAGATGVALGAAASWPIIALVFETAWRFDWLAVAALVGATAALGALAGALATAHALSKRPAPTLRDG